MALTEALFPLPPPDDALMAVPRESPAPADDKPLLLLLLLLLLPLLLPPPLPLFPDPTAKDDIELAGKPDPARKKKRKSWRTWRTEGGPPDGLSAYFYSLLLCIFENPTVRGCVCVCVCVLLLATVTCVGLRKPVCKRKIKCARAAAHTPLFNNQYHIKSPDWELIGVLPRCLSCNPLRLSD